MDEAVLIFTFSPVQRFISEARRASDLFVGSSTLSTLATAALRALEQEHRAQAVFPAPAEGSRDVPNKLVVVIPAAAVEAAGEAATAALHDKWQMLAMRTHRRLVEARFPGVGESTWEAIWARQTNPANLWQCFWAAAPIGPDGYAAAYHAASRAVDAAKRTRTFPQVEEHGLKDSLSGLREALHRNRENAKQYWYEASQLVHDAQLRPDGRERLDAIGVIKRFGPDIESFLSTSSIASDPFLEAAAIRAERELQEYRDAVKQLLGDRANRVSRVSGGPWPYDGDLLYLETLTPQRLAASYGVEVIEAQLGGVREALAALHKAAGSQPTPYYAIIALDGDSIGAHIESLLHGDAAQDAQRRFGSQLAKFTNDVQVIAREHRAELIYNGGDDVLALVPAAAAEGFGYELSRAFKEITGCTASAGIAIAHHLSPLDAVLKQARTAQDRAKRISQDLGEAQGDGRKPSAKDAVSITLMKRGGEDVVATARWDEVHSTLGALVKALVIGDLSVGLAHDVGGLAYAIPTSGTMLKTALRRLIGRRTTVLSEAEIDALAKSLDTLAGKVPEGATGLGKWMLIARFLASLEEDDNATDD